jgi:hypothetical protein
MCDDTRNDHQSELGTCPMCGRTFPIQGRSIYCGPTCRQRAFRLRRNQVHRSTLHLTETLRRERRLTAQTIYECPSCDQRFLGERRCGDCNLMCRKVGLGGECSGCGEILTIIDVIGADLEGGALV